MLQTLEEQIDALNLEQTGAVLANLPGRVFPGRKMMELLRAAQIQRSQRDNICTVIDRVGLFLAKHGG